MKKTKLYLDTSVINFALSEDILLKDKQITNKLCKEINDGRYEGFISEVVLREINNTKNVLRKKCLVNFIEILELEEILRVDTEVDALASKYISEGVIPLRFGDDALHIALASVNSIDILVSWNFKHLVNHKTRMEVMGINTIMGYRFIDICTPWEVIGDV